MYKRPYKTYDLANSEDMEHISANMKEFLTWRKCLYPALFHAANKD